VPLLLCHPRFRILPPPVAELFGKVPTDPFGLLGAGAICGACDIVTWGAGVELFAGVAGAVVFGTFTCEPLLPFEELCGSGHSSSGYVALLGALVLSSASGESELLPVVSFRWWL
jgi:hypothetical protein